jgi:hypothetical protein
MNAGGRADQPGKQLAEIAPNGNWRLAAYFGSRGLKMMPVEQRVLWRLRIS